MSDEKQAAEWNHTALLAALIANAVRDPKRRSRPFDQFDFHPFAKRFKRPRKSAIQLLEKLERLDGQQIQTVTETSWTQSTPPTQRQMNHLTRPLRVVSSPRPEGT